MLLGDVTGDGSVNVKDVTELQRHCALIIQLTGSKLAAADTNQDGKVTIKDATYMQAYIAEMSESCAHCGETITIGGNTPVPVTQPTTSPSGTRTIYFDNSTKQFAQPYCHVWKTENNNDTPYQ